MKYSLALIIPQNLASRNEKYIAQAVTDKRNGVVLRLAGWAIASKPLPIVLKNVAQRMGFERIN